MTNKKEMNLTTLETRLLNDIAKDNQFWAESDFSSSWAFHTTNIWSGDTEQLGGVIASLVKKGIMIVVTDRGDFRWDDRHILSESGRSLINTLNRKRMLALERKAAELREEAHEKEKEADHILCNLLPEKNLNAWKLQRNQS